jgi:murein DD-endopeptidase MepM/ murein hydrolase activator NlpD
MVRRLIGLLAILLPLALVSAASPTGAGWAVVPTAPPPGPVPPPGPAPSPGAFRWPLAGVPRVTRPFQPPPRPWLPGHRGVDLASTPGATVYAAGPGVVAFAGTVAGVGVVSIDHAGGLRTTYEPVMPQVHAGQQVSAGEPIGTLVAGHPGCPVAACLHWGLRRGRDYLDPLLLLHAGRVRLLPLTGAASAALRRAARTRPAGCRPVRTGAAAAARARSSRRPRRAARRRSGRAAVPPQRRPRAPVAG